MGARGRIRTAVLVVTLAISSGWSQPVAAQTVALSPATTPEFRVGRNVRVTVADGRVIEGKIKSVSDTELRVSSGGNVLSVAWPAVRLVEARDTLENGLALGLLIGAGGGALVGVLTSYQLGGGGSLDGALLGGSVLAGLMFAVPISLLVDHAHDGRKTIYRPAAQLSLGPVMAPGRFGVGGVIRW